MTSDNKATNVNTNIISGHLVPVELPPKAKTETKLLPSPTEKPISVPEWRSSYYSASHPKPQSRKITADEVSAVSRLTEMLSYMRPEGSRHQQKFINRFLKPLGCGFDKKGNAYLHIPVASGDAPVTLWSSHTDTVHGKSGRQRVVISDGMLKVHHAEADHCLGADCTTGVWLMTEMIAKRVPGFYIFHAGEEIGGIGSSHIARHEPELVRGFKAAIAFDRRGTRSIITHQAGGRCCSDAFADSLNKQLGGNRFLDSGGTFTDTANYTDLIGECTNVSVGYFNEHSRSERQCVLTALDLRRHLLAFDETKLAFKRQPGEDDWDRWSDRFDEDHWGYMGGSSFRRNSGKRHYASSIVRGTHSHWERDASTGWSRRSSRSNYDELLEIIKHNPEGVADYLETYGTDADALSSHIYDSFGMLRSK